MTSVCLSVFKSLSKRLGGWIRPNFVSLAVNLTVRTAADTGRTNIFRKLEPGESGLANMFAISQVYFSPKLHFIVVSFLVSLLRWSVLKKTEIDSNQLPNIGNINKLMFSFLIESLETRGAEVEETLKLRKYPKFPKQLEFLPGLPFKYRIESNGRGKLW